MTYDDSADSVIFREVQKFRQIWLLALLLVTTGLTWYGAIEQLVYGRPFGSNPASDEGMLAILIGMGIIFPIFMLSIRLVFVVRNSGLYLKFFPFHLSFKHFPFSDIISAEVVRYRPLRDYGGWGIRYGRNGKAYNISGNKGLMLEFRNGKRLLLGSQEPDVLKMSIEQGRNREGY
ncbi:DUF6141 family protein [Methanolobus vulcani]|jgi:uncharacterized membrane protein|uniref:Uncharacterized protein n=1 Tax=Methanolobus vulcani TaxID=38026 RepID=A0A7Z8P4W5_9EURY|nr:DUF6141 family protein [Methanolobus vulcani]TQD26154.1 hypothetical protein FKV42_05185 [Methanolobus vulcani]